MSVQLGPNAYSFESGDISIKSIAINGVDVMPFGPSRRPNRTETVTLDIGGDFAAALAAFAREIDLSVYTPSHGPGSRCSREFFDDDGLPWFADANTNVGEALHMATLRRRGGPGFCKGRRAQGWARRPSRLGTCGTCGGSSDCVDLFGRCAP